MNQINPTLKQRVSTLQWAFPVALAIVSGLYQFGLVRWNQTVYPATVYFAANILVYIFAGPVAVFLAFRQIDRWLEEKARTEQQAQVSERQLALITSTSVDAILSLDLSGCIQSWNFGSELLFGYSIDEVLMEPFYRLFGERAAAKVECQWLIETVHQTGFVRDYETTCQRADGQEIAIELAATRLVDGQGKAFGTSVVLRDITNSKRREDEIRRRYTSLNQQIAERTRELREKAEKLTQMNTTMQKLDQTRSEFVSVVSHQIRAPLTNMGGAVQRMQAGCTAINSTCNRMFTILDQQIARLDRLVQDVLNASRLEAGEMTFHPEPVSVLPVVRQAVEQIRARIATRPIRMPNKPGLPLVYADHDRIAEVLVNLLDNADKYSPPGEEISIEARADQTKVTITVRDFGPGIPPEDFEHMFDKFYRIDSSDSQAAYGYGLGLYVCRRLIEAQGGHIWAENHPNGGAIFSFDLPVWQN